MHLGRTGACIGMAGVYLALRTAAARLRFDNPNPQLVGLVSVSVTALLVLVQLALVAYIVRLRMRFRWAAFFAFLGAFVVCGMIWFARAKLSVPAAITLTLVHDLSLIVMGSALGYLISSIVREPNILLPVAVFAAFVDFWNVSLGPLGHIMESRPAVVDAMSIGIPSVVERIPVISMGMGDIVFWGLFLGVLYRFGMNVTRTFWLGFGLLCASIVTVQICGAPIPALVPMSLAVVAANSKQFKLNRDEQLATLYVAAILLVFLIVWAVRLLVK